MEEVIKINKDSPIETKRSEEVVHIIEHMPTSFGWSVLLIVVFLVSVMAAFGWLIKYPEVLRGEISITSQKSNINIVSNANGKIHLLDKRNGEVIKEGDIIGYIENEADIRDIVHLDSLLNTYNLKNIDIKNDRAVFPNHILLGELSTKYYTFINSYFQYIDYFKSLPFENEKQLSRQNINSKTRLLNENSQELAKLKLKLETAKRINQRDSTLLKNKILSKSDYDKSTLSTINIEQEIENLKKETINTEFQIKDAFNKSQQIEIQRSEKERELEVTLNNNYHDLKENIQLWLRKYAFISPINGKLDYLNFIKNQSYVQSGQPLFSIVPNQNSVIGEIMLPDNSAGKVKIGQDVIVKLNNYPFTEFGSVKGKVIAISLISNQQTISSQNTANGQVRINSYLVTIDFPNGLTTNYGSKLDFHYEAKGTGEIVINKRRLIERLFDNLKYRVK
jgi:multidrug resistance efflux pump